MPVNTVNCWFQANCLETSPHPHPYRIDGIFLAYTKLRQSLKSTAVNGTLSVLFLLIYTRLTSPLHIFMTLHLYGTSHNIPGNRVPFGMVTSKQMIIQFFFFQQQARNPLATKHCSKCYLFRVHHNGIKNLPNSLKIIQILLSVSSVNEITVSSNFV